MEESQGVVGDLLGGRLVLALGSGSNHARLEEDTIKEDIVLSKVEEHLGPHLLCNLKSPVDPVFAIKQDLRLNNWDQTIVLKEKQEPKKDQLLTHPRKRTPN